MGAGSAAQPTSQLRSMADVQRRLTTQCVSAHNSDVQRLREAVRILTCPKPSQEDIRVLQKPCNWNVATMIARKSRPLGDVIKDLEHKVLEAACKLQMQTERSSSASGSAEQPENPDLASLRERQHHQLCP